MINLVIMAICCQNLQKLPSYEATEQKVNGFLVYLEVRSYWSKGNRNVAKNLPTFLFPFQDMNWSVPIFLNNSWSVPSFLPSFQDI